MSDLQQLREIAHSAAQVAGWWTSQGDVTLEPEEAEVLARWHGSPLADARFVLALIDVAEAAKHVAGQSPDLRDALTALREVLRDD